MCTALAMWPKPIQDHPGWGSDSDTEADKQQQPLADNSTPVGSKRQSEQLLGFGTPCSASKRLKSPYEQGKRPERTPEYYGR